jgi:hypothetical protein
MTMLFRCGEYRRFCPAENRRVITSDLYPAPLSDSRKLGN